MGTEIERKFLVKDRNPYQGYPSKSIKQGYLTTQKDLTLRIRIIDQKSVLTLKFATEKSTTRGEYEYDIPYNDAIELLNKCSKTIEKRRYYYTYQEQTFEIDEFSGDNDGLVIAELELESEDQKFTLPSFIGEEVTSDPRFYNSNLIKNPYKSWSSR